LEDARQATAIPGIAVAVVQDGTVAFERGFGVREIEGEDAITVRTLFAIGSLTKPLTTLMMARLVDRGVFEWDTSVLQLKPDFRLGDDATTRQLTMRHTVSASTGLPRQDMELIYQSTDTTPEEVLRRMSTVKPTTDFGEVFQYSNSMVAAGGFIAAHASHPPMTLGQAYDLAMKEEVFVPLGMVDSTLDIRSAFGCRIASPHAPNLWGEVKSLPLSMENALLRPDRPAGAAWSNLRDLEKMLLMELSFGQSGGWRYVSEQNLLERREPQVKMNDHAHYALGLVVEEDGDVPVVSHNGGTNGFTSSFFFLPNHNVGAVVLTNVASDEACFFFTAVRRKLMELWFEGRDQASSDLALELKEKAKQTMVEAAKVEPRPDEVWMESLWGTYQNPALGRVKIYPTKQGSVYEAAEWESLVGRKVEKDGTVKAVLMTPPVSGLEFIMGEKNGLPTLSLELPQQRYVFERV
jgi:CubicO group peptidase (beta-lactamase class C family)